MKHRRIRFTETALRHVRREKQWWVENRTYTEVFADEFEEALRILAILPGAGAAYPQVDVPGFRRIHLRKVGCHMRWTIVVQALVALAVASGPAGLLEGFQLLLVVIKA